MGHPASVSEYRLLYGSAKHRIHKKQTAESYEVVPQTKQYGSLRRYEQGKQDWISMLWIHGLVAHSDPRAIVALVH